MDQGNLKNSLRLFPIFKLEIFNREPSFTIRASLLNKILLLLKNHFKYQFKVLTCITGVDEPKNLYRFKIVYELLSVRFNSRLRVKVFADELMPLNSVCAIFPNSNWWESEVWDMFGVFFNDHPNLVRILTDYGFEGYPLRKDFPLSGFYETRYSQIKNRVVHGTIELSQEYRTFEFPFPWEDFK